MDRPLELVVSIVDRRTGDMRKGLRLCLSEWDSQMAWSLATLLSTWVKGIQPAATVVVDAGVECTVQEFLATYPRAGS